MAASASAISNAWNAKPRFDGGAYAAASRASSMSCASALVSGLPRDAWAAPQPLLAALAWLRAINPADRFTVAPALRCAMRAKLHSESVSSAGAAAVAKVVLPPPCPSAPPAAAAAAAAAAAVAAALRRAAAACSSACCFCRRAAVRAAAWRAAAACWRRSTACSRCCRRRSCVRMPCRRWNSRWLAERAVEGRRDRRSSSHTTTVHSTCVAQAMCRCSCHGRALTQPRRTVQAHTQPHTATNTHTQRLHTTHCTRTGRWLNCASRFRMAWVSVLTSSSTAGACTKPCSDLGVTHDGQATNTNHTPHGSPPVRGAGHRTNDGVQGGPSC